MSRTVDRCAHCDQIITVYSDNDVIHYDGFIMCDMRISKNTEATKKEEL